MISNTYYIYLDYKYSNTNINLNNMQVNGIIISNKTISQYYDKYIIKLVEGKYKNKKFILLINNTNKNKIGNNNKVKYGDLIKLTVDFIKPNEQRNYKGFDYKEYLKLKKIYGTLKNKSNKIEILKNDNINYFLKLSNDLRNNIIYKINNALPLKTQNIFKGIIIGDSSNIDEETIEIFRQSSLIHILVVSRLTYCLFYFSRFVFK